MKKRLLIFLFLLLCMNVVFASISVTDLISSVDENSVTLNCTGESSAGILTQVEFWTDISGEFVITETDTTLNEAIEEVSTTISDISNGNYKWNCVFSNGTVSGTAGTNGTFEINVVSSPEFNGPIADIEFEQDTTNSSLNLNDYFTHTNDLSFTSDGESEISVSINDGVVTFSPVVGWTGSETVVFNASDVDDGSLSQISNEVIVNVTAVDNSISLSSEIDDLSWFQNTNMTLNLDNYFEGGELDELIYNSSEVENVTLEIDGSQVILIPDTDWVGNTTIIFYATDNVEVVASNEINLNVKSDEENDDIPQILNTFPLSSEISMKETGSRFFSIDVESENVTIEWMLDGEKLNETGFNYTLNEPEVGERELKVIVYNGDLTSSYIWSIDVEEDLILQAGDVSVDEEEVESILSETENDSGVCGDGKIDDGENCLNCPEDVTCADDEICDKGECVKKTSSFFAIIIIIFVILIIVGIVFLLYWKNSNKQELNTHRGGIRRGERVSFDKIKVNPLSDVNDYYNEKKELKKEDSEELAPKTDGNKLENYIKKMRVKGYDDKEIFLNLKKNGWPVWEIKAALKNIK